MKPTVDRLLELRVKDVMSRDVVAVHPDHSVHDALDLMVENRVSALPVVDGRDHCIGILSTTDLMDLTRELDTELDQSDEIGWMTRQWLIERLRGSIGTARVDSLMTDTVATVSPERPLSAAAQEMVRNRVHRLPVVGDDGRLVGIISTMDVMASFAENVAVD